MISNNANIPFAVTFDNKSKIEVKKIKNKLLIPKKTLNGTLSNSFMIILHVMTTLKMLNPRGHFSRNASIMKCIT